MRCSRALVLLLSLGASAIATAPPAWAQTSEREPPTGLRESIDGNDEQGFRRRPGTRRARGREPRRTQAPQYGNPPGSGAGSTGYVSTNPRRAPPPPMPGARRSEPATVANGNTRRARPGSANTGPSRPGASIDLPAGTATPPIRRQRPAEEDPFAPVGIRVGSFVFKPALETTAGYDTNPGRTNGGRGSSFITVAPELQVRSNWSRHALNADLRGSYSTYPSDPMLDRPFADARVNGRLDITRQTRAEFEGRTIVSTDNPGSPDLPADLARLPIYTTVGTTAGVTHQFNRLEIGAKGSFDRVEYTDSELTDGSTASNRDRNYDQYAAQLRAAYELTPGMKPFVEAQFDHRKRDLSIDRFGVRRDSDGATGRIGTTFAFSQKLTGEISVGYLVRTYQDPTLPELRGVIADGSLIWSASALTTLKLTAKTDADESTLPGVAGVLRRDFGLQVDHAFRRWLIGTARIGYGTDEYQGSTRVDTRYVASVGVTYKLNREMQLKGELRQHWLTSTVSGTDYTATVALVGLRLQR